MPLRGPDWCATGASPAHDTRCAASGKTVMSRPVSAMIARATSRLTPGISASRSAAGSTAAPGPGRGPGTPSAETPCAAGIWSRQAAILPSRSSMSSVSRLMMFRYVRATAAWLGPNIIPVSASCSSAVFAFSRVCASAASARGSRSPAIIARTMAFADWVVSSVTVVSLHSAPSSSFSSRW